MNVKKLEKGINDYFSACEESGVFPDCAGMRLFLGVTQAQLDKLCGDERRGEKYRALLDAAKDRRESWLARRVPEKGSSRGCMSLLCRRENGGYTDAAESGIRLVIDLEALGGLASAK